MIENQKKHAKTPPLTYTRMHNAYTSNTYNHTQLPTHVTRIHTHTYIHTYKHI
jgi:hypothetical protein